MLFAESEDDAEGDGESGSNAENEGDVEAGDHAEDEGMIKEKVGITMWLRFLPLKSCAPTTKMCRCLRRSGCRQKNLSAKWTRPNDY